MLTTDTGLGGLRDDIDGSVVLPGDAAYDAARQAFSLNVDLRPDAVVFPESVADVQAVVAFATEKGLRIAAQGTSHGAASMGDLSGAILLRTSRLKGVEVDPDARRARVQAGTVWEDVVPLAAEFGLAALHGSSPTVGVVGYSLGGGVGWLARRHGLQTNSVLAIEIVTADGDLHRVDADHEPELFWALRGGGGNFGVVTAIEFALYPVAEVYAGWLMWPFERAADVLEAWRTWTEAGLPDDMTSVGRLLQVPPLPGIPEFLRGKSFVVVEAAWAGDEAEGIELLAPLRALGPQIDTFQTMPVTGLSELHQDPRDPIPVQSDHMLLGSLDRESLAAFVAATGPGSGSPLVSVELRHIGGAAGRGADGHGALDALVGEYLMFALGVPVDEASAVAIASYLGRVRRALESLDAGRSYFNFDETNTPASHAFGDDTYSRLQAVKGAVDPDALFQANHRVHAD